MVKIPDFETVNMCIKPSKSCNLLNLKDSRTLNEKGPAFQTTEILRAKVKRSNVLIYKDIMGRRWRSPAFWYIHFRSENSIDKEYCTKARWCARRDLNPHASRHQNLNLACLPIPPLAHDVERRAFYQFSERCKIFSCYLTTKLFF